MILDVNVRKGTEGNLFVTTMTVTMKLIMAVVVYLALMEWDLGWIFWDFYAFLNGLELFKFSAGGFLVVWCIIGFLCAP